jgi:hypothetical protein
VIVKSVNVTETASVIVKLVNTTETDISST